MKKRIEIISLHLQNFKGARDLFVPFNLVTNIFGENGTYKTTVFDAFKWLLFDKDSTDRKDFEIKTLDINNQVVSGLEHAVTGTITVDGTKKILQKVYKEKWQKKRGSSDSIFTGNETLYYINDIPLSQTEYKKEISNFADETIFKLLTDPLYFSQNMKWQDRRNILLQMSGDISNDEVIANDRTLEGLKELFAVESGIDNIKKMLANRKKKLNDDIKNIPPRIDECNKSIKELDFDSIELSLKEKESQLLSIENDLLNYATKPDPERESIQLQIKNLNQEISNLKTKAERKFNDDKYLSQNEILSKKRTIESETAQISDIETEISRRTKANDLLKEDIEKCRSEWSEINESELAFNEHQFVCPTCNRLLDAKDVDKKKTEMLANFNSNKAKKLAANEERGKSLRAQIDKNNQFIENSSLQIDGKKKSIQGMEDSIVAIDRELKNMKLDYGSLYEEMQNNVLSLEQKLNSLPEVQNNASIIDSLTTQKKELQKDIDSLKTDLRQYGINETMRFRIKELESQERNLANQIAEIEGQEFLCETFIKTKVGMLDEKINSKFSFVRFKLFDTQINGGITEVCEPLINGVPFPDANHAAKINAGIDIINTLSEFYQISAPIFIDNREAVNDLIDTDAQVINLIVSKDKKLKVA